jgi:DNA-binding transcriptional MocR family regulator
LSGLRRDDPPGFAGASPRFERVYWDSLFTDDQEDDLLGRLMASTLGFGDFACRHALLSRNLPDRSHPARHRNCSAPRGRACSITARRTYPPLKQYLQARLRRDGITVDSDELLINNGCQQSLDLLRRVLVGPRRRGLRNPTYPGLWQAFDVPSVRLIGIPVGPEGMDLDCLESTLDRTSSS